MSPAYAELHCLSNFSFQRCASSVDQLAERARQLGYEALAITDDVPWPASSAPGRQPSGIRCG
ncbi:DNA polymerase III alpha subunit [Pseudomonas psychrotolerans]|nr:DNA polymerase III alpha subunit [Pseudomonas psychrotolerans]